MRELSVDFGTSNTVTAFRSGVPGAQARLLTFDGWPMLPSAVWLSGDGALVVGKEAERQARLDPARYEPNPKSRIDDGEILLGDQVISVTEAIAAVLRRVAGEAKRQLGGPPDRLVLTHPAGWHRARRETLLAAARAAGWQCRTELIAEPVAAAAHFAGLDQSGAQGAGDTIAVYDMGGGTTDVAVVRQESGGWRLLAEAGLPDIGGRDIDQLLLEHIRSSVGDRAEWAELARPSTPAARRAVRALADDIRAGKEALSSYPHTDLPLPDPLPDAHVTRQELENLVRPELVRTVELLAGTVRGVTLRGVYLVGGATRMPLVAQLISERLGILPVAVESPESSVALGALEVPASTAPGSSGPHVIGPHSSGPHSTGPHSTGPHSSGPHAIGPHSGPQPLGVTAPLSPPRPWQAANRPQQTAPQPVQQTAQQPSATVRAAPARSRPVRWPIAAGVATIAVVVVFVLVVALNQGSGTTNTGQTGDPSTPASTSASNKNAAAFGGDTALITFAGPTAAKADSCVDAKNSGGGSYGDVLGARTSVRCTITLPDGKPYFANYLSSDKSSTCIGLLQQFLDLPGTTFTGEGSWNGNGSSGSWNDVKSDKGDATVIWKDAGGGLCAFFGGSSEQKIEIQELHKVWQAYVEPGS